MKWKRITELKDHINVASLFRRSGIPAGTAKASASYDRDLDHVSARRLYQHLQITIVALEEVSLELTAEIVD